jgi:hypothetical protein
MKIIVSRYNENIDWTKEFDNVIIYNKGYPLNIHNEILLQNVGREGHTYYQYIYDNYDNLDDYTIFLQGNPFDHSPNIINDIKKYKYSNLDIGFEFLSTWIIYCPLTGCYVHPTYLPLQEVYEKLYNERRNDITIQFGAGAQFIVSKKNILSNPRDFYLKIIQLLEYDVNPIEGFVIERFHKRIMNAN